MKLFTSSLLLLALLIWSTNLYSGTQTLSTYYPAPSGNYQKISLSQYAEFLDAGGIPGDIGSCPPPASFGDAVFLYNNGGILYLCDTTGAYTINSNSLWTGTGTYLYPTNLTESVAIGQATVDANYIFEVAGPTEIGSDASQIHTINGDLTINGDSAMSNNLTVFGNILVGNGLGVPVGGGITLGVGGTAYMGADPAGHVGVQNNGYWSLLVDQNNHVALGAGLVGGVYHGDYNPQATVEVVGTTATAIPGSTVAQIRVCQTVDAGGTGVNCGYLALAQQSNCAASGDCNFYPTYAP